METKLNQRDTQGRKQGLWKWYWSNDNAMWKGYYLNDERIGTWEWYYYNGNLKRVIYYH